MGCKMRTTLTRFLAASAVAIGVSGAQCQEDKLTPMPIDASREDSEIDFCRAGEQGQTRFRPMDQIQARIPMDGERFPHDCSQEVFQSATGAAPPRFAQPLSFNWQPTNFFHRPLYFDDVPLERYGQTRHPHLQPVISGLRFFGTFPVLPYKMGVDPPYSCVTTMGHYPPSTCAPCIKQTLPVELNAAVLEAATWVALVFIFP